MLMKRGKIDGKDNGKIAADTESSLRITPSCSNNYQFFLIPRFLIRIPLQLEFSSF